MTRSQSTLHLLIVDDSLNEAETFVSTLRSAGYAVRARQAQNPEALQTALGEQQADLILCSIPTEGCALDDVVKVVERAEKDVPIIGIVEKATQEALVRAIRAGARDAVPKGQTEHLRLVVDRELTNLELRRALRAAEQKYRDAERRNRNLLDSSRDAITYVTDGMHIYANAAYLNLFGFTDAEEIDGTPIMDMIAPADHPKMKKFLRDLTDLKEGVKRLEVTGQSVDGATLPLVMQATPAKVEDEACFQIVISDVGHQRDLEDRIKALSDRDLLTGLYNRRYFVERLDSAASEVIKGTTQYALLLIAIDDFDALVSREGIAAGDLITVDVADLLSAHATDGQVAARFADHMLALLTTYQDPDEPAQLAEAFRQRVHDHVSEINGQALHPTVSVGLALVSEQAANAQEALRRAQQCADEARKEGGNRVQVYVSPNLDETRETVTDAIAPLVAEALESDRFFLMYQAISNLRGKAEEFYEVFLHLRDNEGSEIPARQFIAAAERGGLMPQVDRWVVDRAIGILATQHAEGKALHLCVNLSERTLEDDEFVPWLAKRLREERMPGEFLILEIPEPAASNNLSQFKKLSKGLKALRVKVSLAQFGGGLNSINFLRHVSADYVKLDHAFMIDLPHNPENQRVVAEIATAAKEAGAETVAEFVEDATSLPVLWQCEVDYIQGYFLQAPSETLSFDFSSETA